MTSSCQGMLCHYRVGAGAERLGSLQRLLCHDRGVVALCRDRDIMSRQGWLQDRFSPMS